MRIHKYRAWDHANECMYYSDNYQNLRDFFAWVEHLREGENTVTLMQYTGLSDKHETEIYEGDFILDVERTGARPRLIELNDYYGFMGCLPEGDTIGHYAVVGNRYENPELLKVDTV